MREKEPRVVAAFESTTLAFKFEEQAQSLEISGRLIPVPREITAGCGLAFSSPVRERERILKLAGGAEGVKVYELWI